jgi:homoserine kinase
MTREKAIRSIRVENQRQVRVRVPATTANLGPGFDCLGLALDLWNEAEFSLEGEGLHLRCDGEGQQIPTDERNMVVQGMRFFCDTRGLPFPRGLTIHCKNQIPVGSGLGSSAAAALIGLLGAAALLAEPLESGEALTLAARMEGHADNAAAALQGGLVIVAAGKGGWLVRRIAAPERQVAVVLPAIDLPTHTARAALPTDIALKDVTYNLGRAMLVVEALRNGDLDLLSQAMDDRLHLPYRLPLIPGGQRALDAAHQAGASAVTISGAGPSLIAFTYGNPAEVAQAMAAAFKAAGSDSRTFLLKTTQTGAVVETV